MKNPFEYMTRRFHQMRVERARLEERQRRENKGKEREPLSPEQKLEEFEVHQQWGPGLIRYLLSLPQKGTPSRQVRRRYQRIEALASITKKFPGEPRRIRRSMAFDFVRNQAKRMAA
jgi:hypothetical protein